MQDKATQNYVDGIAIHWYLDKITPPSVMAKTHKNFPDKFIISTEASAGFSPLSDAVSLGSWKRGENYAVDIMEVQKYIRKFCLFFIQFVGFTKLGSRLGRLEHMSGFKRWSYLY